MQDISFDLAFTSPLKRARDTARLILGKRDVALIEDERIEEITFGEWEGLSCKKDNYQIPSDQFPKFFTSPFEYEPPEKGETILQLIERTGGFYRDLITEPSYRDMTILIAAHGCSSRALLYNIAPSGDDFWRGNVPPNCGVTIVEVKDKKADILELDKVYYGKEDLIDYYRG
ncbi:MAG: histidine phosphatase family protein [Clostridia bacterium]|nr:histidine phosphatase family protein [Clostridia bacterium]